jgi:putative transcriptional regulator
MISNSIKTHREKKNLTQEDLAAAVGVSRQTIIAIEKGNYEPSLGLAFKLAKYFSAKGGPTSGGKLSIEDLFMLK